MIRAGLTLHALASLLAGAAAALAAQQPDTIRGRVVDADSVAVVFATVTAASLRFGTVRTTVTDDSGRYTLVFPEPAAPYHLRVIVLGFEAEQLEIHRTAGERILVADVRLPYRVRPLEPVIIMGRPPRPRPPRDDGADHTAGRGGAVTNDAVAIEQAGNLGALAAALPGMQLVPGRDGDPDGFSALGLPPDQNRTTLNGLATPVTRLPRDAQVSVTVATTPYDVSRGGFSGAEVSVVTRPGSNLVTRTTSANLIAPPLQWTDRAARGQEYTNVSVGGAAAGPIVFDKSYYNVSYQVSRRLNELQSLLNASEAELQAAGVARDSLVRLRELLGDAGIPATVRGVPDNRTIDQASVLAAVDVAPPSPTSGHAYNVTASGNWMRSAPVSTSLLNAFPGHDGTRSTWSGALQGRHTNYFAVGILTETSLGISGTADITSPYLDLPHGAVRVNSSFADGTNAVRTLAFGGSPSLTADARTMAVTVMNRLTWLNRNSVHRYALTSELRFERYRQEVLTNHLGSFSYNSLADLEAGRAASYTRQFTQRSRAGGQFVAGLSIGDSWTPTPDVQVQYGVRVDANRFTHRPAANNAIRVLYGLANDEVPNRAYMSPRVGFAWTYGVQRPYRGAAASGRTPRPSLRGGVGVFQSTPPMNLLASAEDNTGLPSAVQQLRCVGVAAPRAEWNAYRADPNAVPDACADGTSATVFASGAPNVHLFGPGFVMRRSVRANLMWSGPIASDWFVASIDATQSHNLEQPGNVDVNFLPTPRFTLEAEAGRPVFVPPTSIVTSTGAIAARDARSSQEYARVWVQRSDLQSITRQFALNLRPLAVARTNFGWNASYVLQLGRDEVRGFNSTAGNPLLRDRARAALASHQITYQLSYNLFDVLRFSWNGRFQSGTRFTPMVAGDVNGDGATNNDRAFIFDPDSVADSAVANALRTLFVSGSRAARECLRRQINRIAARNTCEAPWQASASLSISVNPIKIGLPPRANLSLQITNPIGALDLLLHGDRKLRGWGQSENPDATLLYVRGFDRTTNQFRYEVNERFGATRPRETIVRSPVMITALIRLDIGPRREQQTLIQQLDRGRTRPGQPVAENALRSLGRGSVPNPMSAILQQRDTLQLTREQVDSLTALERAFTVRLDSLWNPVARHLASLPSTYDDRDAYARFRAAREASVDYLISLVPAVKRLLTREQRKRLSPSLANQLDERYLRSIR